MPRKVFLVCNAVAAIASASITLLGGYGIGAAVVGQMGSKRGEVALAVAGLILAAVAIAMRHRRPTI